ERLIGDGDDLGVQGGVIDPDRLDADLLELAVAARLRTLVPEEGPRIAELDRQLSAVESVLDDRPHHPGRALRPQRHAAATRSEKVYISLATTSVDSPTPRANSVVSSKIGSSMCPYPARRAADVTASRTETKPAEVGGT